MMEWHKYDEEWPKNGVVIVFIHQPDDYYSGEFKKHYLMGMRQFNCTLTREEYFKEMEQMGADCPSSHFWWCYAQDFPFPDKDK